MISKIRQNPHGITDTPPQHISAMDVSRAIWVAVLCVAAVSACQPPDCDRKDCGSCGNACCAVDVYLDITPTEKVYNAMVAALKMGGSDSRYSFKGGYDMRSDNVTADFILQGWHTTEVNHYNDTLDFTIIPLSDTATKVTAFSISQIATAYCDAGQNYKNLAALIKFFGVPYEEVVVHGCPQNG